MQATIRLEFGVGGRGERFHNQSMSFRGVLERESGGFAIDLKNVLLVDREALKGLALSEASALHP
jgi:hypothetical protein